MSKLTYQQIVEKVGNGWALVANPEYKENAEYFSKAVLLFYSSNKKEVRSKIKQYKDKYEHLGFFYLGEIPEDVIYTVNL